MKSAPCWNTSRRYEAWLGGLTAQKQAETELADSRKERERLREFQVASQTATSIAHELNQPLNAVLSYCEAALFMVRAGDPEPDKLASALERSAQQPRRAGQVMRELIEHFRKGDVRSEAVDLDEMMRSATAIVGAAGYDGFEVIVDRADDLRPVPANRAELERVVANLLRNGAEAMLSAGISPQPIRVAVRNDAEDKVVQVSISDHGPGIPKERAERIFEAHFTSKPRGVGMGLTVNRSLVEAHGGRLWVEPDAGPGATIHLTVPFAA
jgi:two-component system sensor kinase FixL